jgi:hypothetical protein
MIGNSESVINQLSYGRDDKKWNKKWQFYHRFPVLLTKLRLSALKKTRKFLQI